MSDPTPSGTVPPAAVHWILETVCAHMMNSPRKSQMLNTMLQNPHYGIEQLNRTSGTRSCRALVEFLEFLLLFFSHPLTRMLAFCLLSLLFFSSQSIT
jgi:hypothetical protein